MSKNFGLGAAVSLSAEAAWGTPPGALVTTFLEVISQTLVRTINKEGKPTIATNGAPVGSGFVCLGEDTGGTLTVPLTLEGLGVFWEHFLGVAATTTADAPVVGMHTHDLALQLYQGPGMTLDVCKGSSNASPIDYYFEVFEGMKASQATLAWSVGSTPTLAIELIGQTSQARTTSATPPTMSILQADSDIDSCDTATITWNAGTLLLNSFSLVINRNLQRNRKIGSKETDEPIPSGLTTVELQAGIDFESNADYNAFLAETEGDLVITVTKVIGANTYTFKVTLHNASITSHDGSPTSGNGLMTSALTWGARSSAGKTGLALQVINASAAFTDL